MFETFLHFSVLMLILSLVTAVLAWSVGVYFKMGAETTVSLGVQTGDAESMNFTTNFRRGQSREDRLEIAQDLFDVVAKRRADNHAAYLEVKRKAIEENEAEAAKGQEQKLHSITEGTKKGS